jgi:Mg2+-importing ATPase
MNKNLRHLPHNKWVLKDLFSLHKSKPLDIPLQATIDLQEIARLPLTELFKVLETSDKGLSEEDVIFRQQNQGFNEILSEKRNRWYVSLFRNISNRFVLLLLFLSLISFFLRDYQSVTVILVMVFIGVVMRFIQEERSNNAFFKLKELVTTKATVIRTKNAVSYKEDVPFKNLVPGDILLFSAGDMIPADIRILSAHDFFVGQASFTGEAFSKEKCGETCNLEKGARVFDIRNICLMGTNVTSGIAKGVVIATGLNTYIASIAESLLEKRALTNFDIGISRVSLFLIRVMLCIVPTVFVINGVSKGDWFTSLLFSLSVAVGLTPEMLPMIVTTTLARGAFEMSKHRVIVKHLSSVQNFGAMDLLCTDKTGTLTEDKIILEKYLDVDGRENKEVLKIAYLNSYHQSGLKNLLDFAILNHSFNTEEITCYKKIDEIPFDFSRKRMSVVVSKEDNTHLLITKGAFNSVINCCDSLSVEKKETILQLENTLSNQGFRTLALAIKESPKGERTLYHIEDESEMTLVGLLVFLDPPKQSALKALKSLMDYGITVKVLTGDEALVAKHVCEAVELPIEGILKGSEMLTLSEVEKKEKIEKATIFAELSPLQKSEIINILKGNGHTVGFLGDGINDAPALREADIGICVDSAVDIAKESSDLVMLEKDLLFLTKGAIEGRRTFANTSKYLRMAISSNFGNVISIVGASFILPFLPMLPLQLLIQNLLYDSSQIALPFDNVDCDFLQKPSSWNSKGLKKFMLLIGPISSIFDYITFSVLFFIFLANTAARQSFFQTGWFIEGLCSQILIVHMLRTPYIPFFQSKPAFFLVMTTITAIVIGLSLPYSPINQTLGMVALPLSYYNFLIPILFGYVVFTQNMKYWFIRRFKFWL